MLSLNPIMNMPEVTLTFKCGVINSDGHIDPSSYKFLTWSYVCANSSSTSDATFSHISLSERVLAVYPHLSNALNRIVYIGKFNLCLTTCWFEYILFRINLRESYLDEENDKIAIPCDNIKETLAALRVITKGQMENRQETPVKIFIHLLPSLDHPTAAGNCQGNVHDSITCSNCEKLPVIGFVYRCLQCKNDYNLCGQCDTAGKHREHVVIRFAGDQVNQWNDLFSIFICSFCYNGSKLRSTIC